MRNKKSIILVVLALVIAGCIFVMAKRDTTSTTDSRRSAIKTGHAAQPINATSPSSPSLTAVNVAGQTRQVKIYEDSGSSAVNVAQVALNYPVASLQYISVAPTAGLWQSAVPDDIQPGHIRLIRAVTSSSAGASGRQLVVTVSFKLVQNVDKPALTIDQAQSMLVSSTTNKDILGSDGVSLTATY